MTSKEWQVKRKELQDREIRERQEDPFSSRPHIQAAITEQGVRELYEKVAALEAKVSGGKRA